MSTEYKNDYPDLHTFRCAEFQTNVIKKYMHDFGMTKSEVIREMINGFTNYAEYINKSSFYVED